MVHAGDQTSLAELMISGTCFQPAGAPLESLRKGLPVGRPNAVRRRPAPLYRVAPPVALRWRFIGQRDGLWPRGLADLAADLNWNESLLALDLRAELAPPATVPIRAGPTTVAS
jgi:hypothetical protein